MSERNQTYADHIKELRIINLKLMHDRVCHMSHEGAYMWWIEDAVPDDPSEDDFIDIAEDDEMYEDCVETFLEILKKYGKYGFVKE